MASKALNAANLEALGATRLARLLIEISEGNAPVKRRLRLRAVQRSRLGLDESEMPHADETAVG